MMKNLLVYYIFMLGPFFIIMWWRKTHKDNPWHFIIMLFVYLGLYRPIIDGIRLRQKNLITKSEARRLFIPFNGIFTDHFVDLYFRR